MAISRTVHLSRQLSWLCKQVDKSQPGPPAASVQQDATIAGEEAAQQQIVALTLEVRQNVHAFTAGSV